MSCEVFTVYDSAARRYMEPFFAETIEVACRMFRALCSKPEHQFNKFPEDYVLFHIGSYSGESGMLVPLEAPHSLGVALTFLPRGPQLEVANA